MIVFPTDRQQASYWIERVHYARRWPSVSYIFAGIEDGSIIGVVTFGTPPSPPLRSGILGPEWADRVLELNRLCCENRPNVASELVAGAIRQLPRPRCIVSYADTAQGHEGIVYRACNFTYTGLSADRTDWTIEGEDAHGITIADRFRGAEDRASAVREEYGDRFSLQRRSRKHRYVYFHGNRYQRAEMRSALRYQVVDWPKNRTAPRAETLGAD